MPLVSTTGVVLLGALAVMTGSPANADKRKPGKGGEPKGLAPVWGIHVQEAEAAWAQDCGCPLKIVVKAGFNSYEEKGLVRTAAQDVLEIARSECANEEAARSRSVR
jgi:hypothetical protein